MLIYLSVKIGNNKSKTITQATPTEESETSQGQQESPRQVRLMQNVEQKDTKSLISKADSSDYPQTGENDSSADSDIARQCSAQLEPCHEVPISRNLHHSISKLSHFDFKGLMAPVFTCFKDDEQRSLNVRPINRYAEYLKSQNIRGIFGKAHSFGTPPCIRFLNIFVTTVNSVSGEGPSLGVKERKANCEYWFQAAVKHDLIMMLQIGGAPMTDVIDLAVHAQRIGVHAVCCLPDLFYKPRSVDHLVGYCRIVAERCKPMPFLYYHIPYFSGVHIDMNEFCAKAEAKIPNFYGINYSSTDLDMGCRSLREGRVVMLATGSLIGSGIMAGFTCIVASINNIRPDIVRHIMDAVKANDIALVRRKQEELNRLVEMHTHHMHLERWIYSMKIWFNKEMIQRGFSAGPSRKPW